MFLQRRKCLSLAIPVIIAATMSTIVAGAIPAAHVAAAAPYAAAAVASPAPTLANSTPGGVAVTVPLGSPTAPALGSPAASPTLAAAATPTARAAGAGPATSTVKATATGTATNKATATGTAKPGVTTTQTVTPTVKASLALTPTVANRGGVVTLSGAGFAANETVDITITATTPVTAMGKADANGLLPPTGVSLPYSLVPGAYGVSAQGAASKRLARGRVTVQQLTPSITLSPAAASPGGTVTVTGKGFGPQEQVTLALNGSALTTMPAAITTTNGAFTATFVAPSTLLRGPNTISAIGNQSRVTAVTALTGQLSRTARYYFAGGLNTSASHSFVALLNPNAQPASVRLTFYFANTTPRERTVTVEATSQRNLSVAGLSMPVGTFGLQVESDRQISAQINIARDGKDGDNLLGNSGLGTTWYLAEGYTGLTFHETVSILNPDPATAAHVQLQLLPIGGGAQRSVTVNVSPQSNVVQDINSVLPGKSISIVAISDRPVVVERTLTFGNGGYGITTRAGINTAAQTWIFAEGTTANRFQTFQTILNPGDTPAIVTAGFFGQTGGSLGSRTLVVPARSRANIKYNDFLTASAIASVVTSDHPVVIERPEYFGSPNSAGIPGSDVFGRNGAGVTWSFPGGNSGSLDEFLLVYNPSAATVPIVATFYGPHGQTVRKQINVPPTIRYNINVNTLIPGFAAIHGAILHTDSPQGFVAEQTVFSPDHSTLRGTQGLAQ